MKFRFAIAALATVSVGLAFAQTPTPAPQPSTPLPSAAADATAPVAIPPAPKPAGTAWVLMDFTTGQVLAGENYNERVEPASITKVMTSYTLAAEQKNGKIKPDDQVMLS
ncbi:MAG: serine-type D-Ala-D-Ala carboxypeptidase, partial [Pseudoxanthomonas sp.]